MLIAHDLGTSALKSTLHDADGVECAAAETSYRTDYGAGGRCEQDPEHWWAALVANTHTLLASSGVDARRIEGLCIAGHMMGLVLLDADLRPTRPAMIWSDQRARREADALGDALGLKYLYQLTGHRIGPTYTIAKLMWVMAHEPDAYARARHVCVAKDYLNTRLTGRVVTDHTDASSTGAYNLSERTWSPEILRAAGVEPALFPPIVQSTDVVGTLCPQAARELGLPATTRVVAGGGDGPIATIGAGCTRPADPLYASLGTSAWFAGTTRTPHLDPEHRSFTFTHVDASLYCPCATSQNGAGTLDWLATVLAPGKDDAVGALIDEACALADPDPELLVLPYLLGERSPWWSPHARGAVVGLTRRHGRAHLMRATLEGIGYTLAACLDAVAGERNVATEGVDVIGGGSRSAAWLQLLSTMWGVPVRRRSTVTTATSLGAAVTGLTGLGRLDLAAARHLSSVDRTFEPGPEAARYASYRQIFNQTFAAVEPLDRASAHREAASL
ncbi:MAG: FGGY-family carbohydrate kinase [Bowdeniella nasicola]|nr:FGGY-family carbohydrate kinase [Bowdeniella nasicola]